MIDPDETQAVPDLDDRTEQSTEISLSEAEAHEAALAVSQDDSDDIVPDIYHRSVRRRLSEAAGLGLMLVLFLGGTAMTFVSVAKHPPRPPVQSPVKGPIDGTYRIDRHRGEPTTRAPDEKFSAAAPKSGIVETEWWAFQSACSPPSCIAIATRLDDATHTQIAARLASGQAENKGIQSLRLVNGKWVSDPPNRMPQDCAAGKPGRDMWRFTMELTQLADGTLKGQESDLIESNECGRAGTVVTTPLVATRIGDLPAGLPPLRTK